MPHAALWVVQLQLGSGLVVLPFCFNAARGFVGGAAVMIANATTMVEVSMPHAALWVVQPNAGVRIVALVDVSMPHAALWVVQRNKNIYKSFTIMFQCRTRLCGWCSLVARSSCPPREKKPFWKVSGNLRVLTENM